MTEQEERLTHYPTWEDKIKRLDDVLRYASQEPGQTLLPDGLLKDVAAILPVLARDVVSVEEIRATLAERPLPAVDANHPGAMTILEDWFNDAVKRIAALHYPR